MSGQGGPTHREEMRLRKEIQDIFSALEGIRTDLNQLQNELDREHERIEEHERVERKKRKYEEMARLYNHCYCCKSVIGSDYAVATYYGHECPHRFCQACVCKGNGQMTQCCPHEFVQFCVYINKKFNHYVNGIIPKPP